MTKHQCFIGIDPGAKGALCALIPRLGKAAYFDTTAHPLEILAWFEKVSAQAELRAIMVEEVSSIMGASAGSNFNFGRNVGVVNTIALASGYMVDKAKPKEWQKAVGLTIPAKLKGAARQKAIKQGVADICGRLYPNVKIHGPKGGLHDGKSDALMLAHYCYLKHKME